MRFSLTAAWLVFGAGIAVTSSFQAAAQNAADVQGQVSDLERDVAAFRRENAALRERAKLPAETATVRRQIHSNALSSSRQKASSAAGTKPDQASTGRSPMDAYAADLPVKAPVPVRAPYNWAGTYIGAHVGSGFGNTHFAHGSVNAFGFDGLFLGGTETSGPLAGVQAGINFQTGRLVWGLESDASWSDIKGGFFCFAASGVAQSCNSKTDWIATATGRVGIAADRLLVFAKAGAVWAHDRYANPCPLGCVAAGSVTWSGDTIRTGWIVGGGLEYGIGSRWSLKFEYNYLDFGTANVLLTPNVTGQGVFDVDARQTTHLIKAGFNYRLGPSQPYAAGESVTSWASPHPATGNYWTGVYLGVSGGGFWGKNQHISSAGPANFISTAGPQTNSFDLNGGLAGGTVGVNWQQADVVIGLEGDMSWANGKAQVVEIPPFITALATTEQKWLATGRLRVGLLPASNWLVYATGGFAVMGVKATVAGNSDTQAAWGWTAGGGVEVMVDRHWSVKTEYLYVDTVATFFDPPDVSGQVSTSTRYIPVTEHIVRAGLNYRFNNFAWR